MSREQRRLAAILVADVVGFSRLIGADETGTLARLAALRRKIVDPNVARHSGRLFKETGDGFLVEFASAVQAVTCAMEIQNAAGPDSLTLRIGIHVGDVVVQGDDLMGDGINIAARIEGIAEPGGITVSRAVHEQVRDRLAVTFADRGEIELKNIGRPVHIFTVGQRKVTPAATTLALPDKPSIAVLPFQNLSGDPEQEYFADGVVEDIITALSNFKSLFVIARNSSFTFKGRTIDIKQVGRELGVRYILEGSIRKSAARVRITGQLIEAFTGAHLWAEKIDGELSDVFELQDQITARVVSALAPTIEQAEIARLKHRPASNSDSYDTFLRGMALVYQRQPRAARDFFKKAAEQDPDYAAAYAMAACTYTMEQAQKGIIPTSEMRADALQNANTALGLTNEDAFVLGRCSHPIAYICQQIDRGALLADRAVTLNPNLSFAWGFRGWILLMQGKPEQAIESFQNLMTLSPLDPARTYALSGIAFGHFFLNRYDEGRRVAKEILQIFPHHQSFATYIINSVGIGDIAEAKSAAIEFLKFDPEFSISRASAIYLMKSLENRNKIDNALRTAGLPE